jgi:hypothetical protein
MKINLREIEREDVVWIRLAQIMDQWRFLVTTAVNIRVLQQAGNFLTGLATINSSRNSVLWS